MAKKIQNKYIRLLFWYSVYYLVRPCLLLVNLIVPIFKNLKWYCIDIREDWKENYKNHLKFTKQWSSWKIND